MNLLESTNWILYFLRVRDTLITKTEHKGGRRTRRITSKLVYKSDDENEFEAVHRLQN